MPPPEWLWTYLGVVPVPDGATLHVGGQSFALQRDIPRARTLLSSSQDQAEQVFCFKWGERETFESPASLSRMKEWLMERYGGPLSRAWLAENGERPLLLDAGCGASMSAHELFGPLLQSVRYLGVDVSAAIDVAGARFAEGRLEAAFMQADLCDLPFPERSVDIIFSEGVLHTDSTEGVLKALAKLLKPGGRFLFYVYRKKGPVREFTDDQLRSMPPEDAWKAMEPLTRLGIPLGELDAEITIPEGIDLLGIPAGRINVQRLFYWHVAKIYYRPDLSFEEMNHINFDWYAPANAHRQTPDEVLRWCDECNLQFERKIVEEADITIVARRAA